MNLQDFIAEMMADSEEWFPNEDPLIVWTLGLCGEAGEVADIVKKVQRGSKALDEAIPLLHEELIDVFHYWCLLVGLLVVDVESTYRKKREFNRDRFGTDAGH